MTKMPFKMLPSRYASLSCDGKFVVAGRASFVWETFLMRRASGVPGAYVIRNAQTNVRHSVSMGIEEAEEALLAWSKMFGRKKVERMRAIRAGRERRGLPVG